MKKRSRRAALLLACSIGLLGFPLLACAEDNGGDGAAAPANQRSSPSTGDGGTNSTLHGNLKLNSSPDQPRLALSDPPGDNSSGGSNSGGRHWWNTPKGRLFIALLVAILIALAVALPIAIGVHNANLNHRHNQQRIEQQYLLQYLDTHQHLPPSVLPFVNLVPFSPPVVHHHQPPPPPPPPK